MFSFQGENILSVNQLDRDSIEHIFSIAKKWNPTPRSKSALAY